MAVEFEYCHYSHVRNRFLSNYHGRILTMKKYLLFVFSPKKPVGGWRAFRNDYATLPAAQKAAKKYKFHQIVNLETGQIVEEQE